MQDSLAQTLKLIPHAIRETYRIVKYVKGTGEEVYRVSPNTKETN